MRRKHDEPRNKSYRHGRRRWINGAPANINRNVKFNYMMLFATAIAGVVAWMVDYVLLNVLESHLPRPVNMAILFAVLGGILLPVTTIISGIYGAYEGDIISGGASRGTGHWRNIAGLLILTLLTGLFQIIYQIEPTQAPSDPTSYIFLIDDSGSTRTSDPGNVRYTAISKVLEGKADDFPYMVYRFSDKTDILRDMGAKAAGVSNFNGNSIGGTNMKRALSDIYEDYKQKKWDGGDRPRVILLSDGYATDISFFRPITGLLRKYKKTGISISTVGFNQVDTKTMTQIADATGGVFISVNDVSGLGDALTKAATENTELRTLVSDRHMASLSVLFGMLRVLFLTILGTLLALLLAVAYGNFSSRNMILSVGIVKAFIGALVMELGTVLLGANSGVCWFLLWVLIATTPAMKPVRNKHDDEGKKAGDFSFSTDDNKKDRGTFQIKL